MTMVFKANDPAMLTAVKAGDKVQLMPIKLTANTVATKIEKAK